MKGTRPLDNTEIRQVADGFDGVSLSETAVFSFSVSPLADGSPNSYR